MAYPLRTSTSMTAAASTAPAAAATPAYAAPPPAAAAIGNTIEPPLPPAVAAVDIARIAVAGARVVAGAVAVVVGGIALLGLEYYPNHYQRRRIRRQQSSVQGQTL